MLKQADRYMKIGASCKVVEKGKTLESVQRPGPGCLIDYKLKRFTFQGFYPTTRQNWMAGIPSSGTLTTVLGA